MFKNLRRGALAEWGSAILVLVVSGAAGQFAAHGMNTAQWAGAVIAVGGSIAVAVMVRVWPEPAGAAQRQRRDR